MNDVTVQESERAEARGRKFSGWILLALVVVVGLMVLMVRMGWRL